MHEVVIVGGGFGGLSAARALRRAPARVTLVDRRNFHLFQPLLYQVATGGLSPANIAAPLRALLRRQKNARVILGEAIGIDPAARRVILRDGVLAYDTLIVAAGARHHYFGHGAWEGAAPGLKTVEDATEIRRRLLLAFESAEREADPARQRAWLTFVVVGGGPTGVELAGAVAELARHTLRRDFRAIAPETAAILLVEGADRLLTTFPPSLSAKAARSLRRLGVEVRLRTSVTSITAENVILKSAAAGEDETIPTRTIVWAAGVAASPLGRLLSEGTGAAIDRAGRVAVGPHLCLPGRPEIFVIGDLARCEDRSGRPLPGVAPVAVQQGRYAARVIGGRLRGAPAPPPFRYRDLGTLATIGRAAAVADLGWVRFSGYPAWLFWLFLHLMMLVHFESRLLVFVQWAWSYLTRNRAARLITGAPAPPLTGSPGTAAADSDRPPRAP